MTRLRESGRTYSALLWLSLCLAPVNCLANAQQQADEAFARRSVTEATPANCERNILVLEGAHYDASKDGLIILIARLGKGESRKELNDRRLHSARAYLTDYLDVRSPKTIIIAVGDRVEGYGRIEVYVAGKLYHVISIRRNADLSVGSCEPEELDDSRQAALRRKLYPWRYRTGGATVKKPK